MFACNQSPVIREKLVDDGTTCGKKMIQTADGRWWKEVSYGSETAGTGETMATLTNGIVRW